MIISMFLIISCNQANRETKINNQEVSSVLHKEIAISTPSDAVKELKAGNDRFKVMKLLNTGY